LQPFLDLDIHAGIISKAAKLKSADNLFSVQNDSFPSFSVKISRLNFSMVISL
jgi:hypothetical protein